jgi:pimeloyl-ACP methyl ester carboxylesterase
MREIRDFFEIDGDKLEYHLITPRQSRDTTLVFLHEGLGCVTLWKDFPRRVAEATGYPTLAYSRAGYGGSTPCQRPRPITFMHDEGLKVLPKVFAAAGISQAILVGHSDGASIALINAGSDNDQRLRGLVLLAPHVFVEEELTVNSIRKAKSAYLATDLRQRLARYHGDNVDHTFLSWVDTWLDESFLAWNIEGFLPSISVPTLLIQGDEDNYGTLRQVEIINKHLPGGADMFILPGCGHAPFREYPSETLNAITAFLEKHQLLQPE